MISKADLNSISKLAELANKLWSGDSIKELEEEFLESLDIKNEELFIYEMDNVGIIAFIQLALRYDYVEGCNSSPVAYIEGIYVEEEYRRNGIAQELVRAAENWGKDHGCTEIASDCELYNVMSIDFHKSAGFIEENRVVCFKKDISI